MNLVAQASKLASNKLKHHSNFHQSWTQFQFWFIYKDDIDRMRSLHVLLYEGKKRVCRAPCGGGLPPTDHLPGPQQEGVCWASEGVTSSEMLTKTQMYFNTILSCSL